MNPTDPADAHLKDRAIELRVLKSAIVVFFVALAAVFYRWELVFVAFLLGYTAYRFRYYRNRVGVYNDGDNTVRDVHLELGLLALGVAIIGVLVAIQAVFSESWELGGFLSLPEIDFTDPDGLLDEPSLALAWAVVAAPVVVVSYVGMQLRQRLLVGLDSPGAAVRAIVWDVLVHAPVYLLWVAALTVGPVYEVWEPVPEFVEETAGLEVSTVDSFAVVLGDAFTTVTTVGLFASAAVVAAYLGVQRLKYHDVTIPEVLGYRGALPASFETHNVNVVVPVAIYLLFALVVVFVLGLAPLATVPLLGGVAVSLAVGANVFATTLTAVRSLSEWVADSVDAVVVGLAAGLVFLGLSTSVFDAGAGLVGAASTYLVVAVPLTFAGNVVAGRQAVDDITAFAARIEDDPDAFDQKTADRLFVYSTVRNPTVRTAAFDGLATVAQTGSYRNDDALDVFVKALESGDEQLVQPGLRGLATVLRSDRTRETYERLVDAGVHESTLASLDSGAEETRLYASEVFARLSTLELGRLQSLPTDWGDSDRVTKLSDIAGSHEEDAALVSAVAEYFAVLWYLDSRGESDEVVLSEADRQLLLGDLLWATGAASPDARLRATLAVTADRAEADEERLAMAVDALTGDHEESRYLAAFVVRSSMDRHAEQIEAEPVLELLNDPSPAVRWMGAETVLAFVNFSPRRGAELRDRLIDHLEEHEDEPGRTEGAVLRALASMDTEKLVAHPGAASTIAGYVGVSTPEISKPAAHLVSSLVDSSRSISQQEAVTSAVERGLEHPNADVRLACLGVVTTLLEGSIVQGRRFVPGLGANLAAEGERGVLAAVSLAQILEAYPEDGFEILPELSAGLENLTAIDRQAVPFLVRGRTVSAVTVEMVGDVVRLDPERCESLVEPLITLATTAEQATLAGTLEILVELTEEFPTESKDAVEAAAIGIEGGSVGMRRDACRILANVAAYHPDAVEPFVDRLVMATDDDSQRVRGPALVALTNVCAALPRVIEADIHRVVGCLDDDSAIVRTQAADLVATVAEREPEIIEPAAETADRLRRLQRDPAVDSDPKRLQDASTAIQTGVPTEEADAGTGGHDREEIWSPETSSEMGVSGDTNVFEPVGDDFDVDFDEFDEDLDDFDENFDDVEVDAGDDDEDVGDHDTVIQPGDEDDDVGDHETVIQPADDDEDDDVGDHETVIQPDEPDDDVGDHDTVIQPGDEDDDVGDHDTVIQPNKETGDDDVGDHDTVIQPSDGTDEDVGDHDTVIQPADEPDEDVGDHDTVIQPADEPDEDVGDHDTVIQPADEPDEDVGDHDTVIQPDESSEKEEQE